MTETGAVVSYESDIRPLFRDKDREAMSGRFDLWSYEDVSRYATPIFARLRSGTMPCDVAWPDAQVELFRRWIDSGKLP